MTAIPLKPATTLSAYNGEPMDLVTIQFVQRVELVLGFPLTIAQGYNPDNFATSGGTHGFGVVDLAPERSAEKLEAWAAMGGFIWFREEIEDHWAAHHHGGVRNHPGLSEPARAQQRDFDGDPPRSGLKYHAVDLSVLDYRPKRPVQFVYDPGWRPNMPEPTKVEEARMALQKSIHKAGDAIALLREADESRVVARGLRDEIRKGKRIHEAALAKMPEK